jgi:ATP-dependent Clp protease ATP-binding subunit ClpC
MFERFDERARQVVVLAQDEARALRHNYIGTEHLLLGLLREEIGLAAQVLAVFDVTIEEVRARVARLVGMGDDVAAGQIPFTPPAKQVLELALREALAIGHNSIGTEHLLLGLARLDNGVAAEILATFDLDEERITAEVMGLLSRLRPVRPGVLQPQGRWEYDVKTLDGGSETWPAQLQRWSGDGWELISVVQEGGAVRAIVERRRRSFLD